VELRIEDPKDPIDLVEVRIENLKDLRDLPTLKAAKSLSRKKWNEGVLLATSLTVENLFQSSHYKFWSERRGW